MADPNGCPKLKEQLEALGFRGQGSPCQWRGITCSSPCSATSIMVRDGQPLSGDIRVLADMTQLRLLRLRNTEVTGDISAFVKLKRLQRLWLRDTRVTGNLQALENLTELRTLDLYNTGVAGDLSSMRSLQRLQKVDLKSTQVTGDIGSLHLPELRWLCLYGTRVMGDIAGLSQFKALVVLDLDNTEVIGDVRHLQGLTGLRKLWLINTRVEGDIAVIQNFKGLWNLDLQNTKVEGDIAAVQNLKEFWNVKLANTRVQGNIAAVQYLKRLWKLSLHNTRIKGDLSAVQDLQNLEHLSLDNTHLEGALASVQNLTKLKSLSLSNTSVDGDVAAVHPLQNLTELKLSDSKVSGDVSVVTRLEDLELLDLARTSVSGWLTGDDWNGCCKKLREINLADAALGPLPVLEGTPQFFTDKPLLPALQTLNVSGSKLNGSIANFLLPLGQTAITAIAASDCGLSGAMPDLTSVALRMDGWLDARFHTKLVNSLQVLDVSHNCMSSLASLPAAVRVDVRHNQIPLTLHPSVLQQAVKHSVDLWLDDTKVANPETLEPLLAHELRLQTDFSASGGSFACRELVEPALRITPQLFMPDLMCACQPGYEGFGIACFACPDNTYASAMNTPECIKCPLNSSSRSAATSWQQCRCAFGSIHQDESAQNALSCQCPAKEALVDIPAGLERCEPCHKLRLKCPVAGSHAATAPVEDGFIRLQPNSHETFQCLDLSRCNDSACVAGYDGVLCSDCAEGHRSVNGHCEPCASIQNMSAAQIATPVLCSAGVLVVLGAAWTFRHRFGDMELGLPSKCAMKLLVPQLAILLQLMQLWSVLARLAQVPDDVSNGNAMEVESHSDVLATYVEALQLTSMELQSFFALQCIFHGTSVRLAAAVATPVAPLVLLVACGFMEVFHKGSGIQVGLKILTVLFIGGAAGTAQLLGCQSTDGTGEAPLHEFSFRPLAPHLRCTDAFWVDWIGRACAVFYGALIPCFLAFLFAKQHVVMKQSKTFVVLAEGGPEEVTLQLHVLSDKECLKEHIKRKRLIAAAAAYVAVHVKKRALVRLKDADAAMVQIKEHGENAGDDFDAGFSVDDLVQSEDAAQIRRERTQMLRYNAIMHMLAERGVLAEIQLKHSDRVMAGATELFCKYVNCGFVWLEVCLKLASAALVSVVASKNGLWLSVAITLGMALLVGLAQPFMHPQLNALQTCCFVCLAMAALGFHVHWVWWLSRVALVLPVLLLVLLMLRPDSKEALALRLQEELEKKLPEGPVEVSAEQVRFV